jgi:hypothetical protein
MEKELRLYKDLDILRNATLPDSVHFVFNSAKQKVTEIWVTNNQNVPKQVDLSDIDAQDLISNQIGNTLILGLDGKLYVPPQTQYSKVSAENIPSYTPVAIYNNLAYKFDNLNPLHQFAFVGFSTNGTSIGQSCTIKQVGEVTLAGWNLTPNTQYLAGALGALQTSNTGAGFTKVVGYATTADTLQIIKDYTTINK